MSEITHGWLVEVYLYDLSQGMAATMSQGFLGKRIECIPHSGLIIYGYEYFFGGGIQTAPPGMTVAGAPWRKYPIGFTTKTQEEFHAWCNQNAATFSPANYDLLTHNCNNFCEAAAMFLTGKHIPEFIVQLPEDAMSSPMGASLRPMIESMMNQVQNSGAIPGMNNPVVRPNLPHTSSRSAPVIREEDRQRVRAYDQEEAARNAERARERERERTSQQNPQFQNPSQANPFAHLMQQNQQAQASPMEISDTGNAFHTFEPSPKPFLTLDKNQSKALDNYEKRMLKTIKNADAQALIKDLVRICKTSTESLSDKHFMFIMKLTLQLPANKLLSVLSLFRYMTARPEGAKYFLSRQDELLTLLEHVGMIGDKQVAKDYILVLVNVSLAHIYSHDFPISDKLVQLTLHCVENYSNTVSLSSSRFLFNMILQMEKEMDDNQCLITSALLENLPKVKHLGTRRRILWILCYMFYHIEDSRDLAHALDFDVAELKAFEGNQEKDIGLIGDLTKILGMNVSGV